MSTTAAASAVKGTAFWRAAGLTYLQYLGVSTNVIRSTLKEPIKSRALARSTFFYNKAYLQGDKIPIGNK